MAFEGSSGNNGQVSYVTPKFPIIDYKCHLTRSHNETRPDGLAWCDRIELDVEAPGKSDLRLYEWYISRSLMSGHLVFKDDPENDDAPDRKEILFHDALCYGISEKYDIGDNARRILHLSIVADVTTFIDVTYTDGKRNPDDGVELNSNAISPFIETK